MTHVRDTADAGRSGTDAMLAHAAVSGPRLAAVGGRFLLQGFPAGTLWGDDDTDWDLVVVAEYPDLEALWTLLRDDEYRAAYEHRRAAVEVQRVLACTPF